MKLHRLRCQDGVVLSLSAARAVFAAGPDVARVGLRPRKEKGPPHNQHHAIEMKPLPQHVEKQVFKDGWQRTWDGVMRSLFLQGLKPTYRLAGLQGKDGTWLWKEEKASGHWARIGSAVRGVL